MAIAPTTFDPYYFDEVVWGTMSPTLSPDGLTITTALTDEGFYFPTLFSTTTGKFYFEMSYPARPGATEIGIFPIVRFDTWEHGFGYTQTDYASAGTVGVYIDVDAGYVGYITPQGVDQGSTMVAAGATVTVLAYPQPVTSTPPGGWVATFNFGASAFVHSPPVGYALGFGVAVDYGAALICPSPTAEATGTTISNVAHLSPPSPLVVAFGGASSALAAPTPTVTAHSGATSALTAPSPRLSSLGHDSTGENAAHITAPSPALIFYTGANAKALRPASPTLSASGTVTALAKATLRAPKPTLSASGTVTEMATAALTAPRPNLVGYGGATTTVRAAIAPALEASGTVGSVAHASVMGPSAVLAAYAGADVRIRPPTPALTSAALVGGIARAALTTRAQANLVGYGGAVCSVSVTGSPTLQANGTTGGVASAQVTCPLFELTSTASIGNVASASLIAPSPQLGRTIQAWLTAPSAKLTAIGSAVVTATYEAYAVNLGHRPRVTDQEVPIDEVTHYTNFPFTHVVRYQNSYYGANSTGLYLLEGTTDAGAAIPWAVKTAMDDFKTPLKKTVAAAYFGGRFGPASTVQLHAGEQTPNTYSFSTPRDALAQNHRQVFGKGVKERYFALGASGIGTVELDTIELETHNMTRRI